MDRKANFKIMELKKRNEILANEMREYYKFYKHRNPCKEWIKNKWCSHYIKARYQKFKERINGQISEMINLAHFNRKSSNR